MFVYGLRQAVHKVTIDMANGCLEGAANTDKTGKTGNMGEFLPIGSKRE
jgi:hypothetical protein